MSQCSTCSSSLPVNLTPVNVSIFVCSLSVNLTPVNVSICVCSLPVNLTPANVSIFVCSLPVNLSDTPHCSSALFQSHVTRSFDDFTRLSRGDSRTSVPASAYINDAFSFLQGDHYDAYKYYEEEDPNSRRHDSRPNSRHSSLPYQNGYANGFGQNGHQPEPAKQKSDRDPLHVQVKIALIVVVLAFIAVIIAIAVVVVICE